MEIQCIVNSVADLGLGKVGSRYTLHGQKFEKLHPIFRSTMPTKDKKMASSSSIHVDKQSVITEVSLKGEIKLAIVLHAVT